MRHRLAFASDLGRMPARWSLPSHRHDDYHELVLVADGRVDMEIGGVAVATTAGWCKLHPSGVAHAERAVGATSPHLLIAVFTGDVAGWPVQRPDAHGRLGVLLRWLIELGQRAGDTDQREAVFAALLAAYTADGPAQEDALVGTVRRHVLAHLADPLYLAGLARAAGLSPFHFARRFRAAAGCSPMAFVRRLRVERARALLLSSTLTLRQIAPQVGLRDEFQLSRVFRQIDGHPPSRLRPVHHTGR